MTSLYRLYGADNKLIYIGITDHLARRLHSHSEKRWWSDVAHHEITEFPDRQAALLAEAAAIATERPRENRAGTSESARVRAHRTTPKPSTAVGYESIEQAAKRLGVSSKTVRRRIADGTVPAYRMGPHLIRLDPSEVDAGMKRRLPTVGWGA